MEPMTVRELLAATDGKLLGDVSLDTTISGVETDSRAVHDGDLFVAIRGENIDGHQFITGALEGGALGCLTAVPPKEAVPGKFYVLVEDTVQALGQVARAYKAKFPIPVIGITGSVGKTTTKDMIASVLSQKFRVLKTEGNYNNEIGLPLTLFRLNPQHELCVLEMGMNHFGEIDYLTRIVSPNVAVITNIGDAHIENLGSREGILKAKSEIFQAMTGDDLAVLNGDDPLLRTLDGKIAPGILWCGADHEPPYEAKEIRQMGAKGLQCKIKTPKTEFTVTIPALGNHMIYPVLMACAIGEKFGMTGEEMKKGVEAFIPTKMRMNVIRQGDVTFWMTPTTPTPSPCGRRWKCCPRPTRRSAWPSWVICLNWASLAPSCTGVWASAPLPWATSTRCWPWASWPGTSMTRPIRPAWKGPFTPRTGRRQSPCWPTSSGLVR